MAKDDDVIEFYGTLHARRVDLIGDFAGRELFLIDGDSLLLHLFSDPGLDFDGGFQLLHLVYCVESFLKQLIDRSANFSLVWFESNDNLCIPPTDAAAKNANKYLLAKEVIIRHIDNLIKTKKVDFKVHKFVAPEHETALEFYESSGAYFIMCHDGANMEHGAAQRNRLRSNIKTFITSALSVAIVNEIAFQDTKVMTQIVEGRAKSLQPQNAPTNGHSKTEASAKIEPSQSGTGEALLSELEKIAQDDPSLFHSQRTFVLICASRNLLEQHPQAKPFVSAVLLHLILLQHLPLAQRRIGPVEDITNTNEEHSANILALADECRTILSKDSASLNGLECDIADAIDGRLLSHAHRLHKAINLPASIKVSYSKICALANVPPLALADKKSGAQTTGIKPSADEGTAVLEFSNECFDSHLKDIELSVTNREPKDSSTEARIFADLTHWHGTKPVSTKAVPISDDRALRRNQLYLAEMSEYAASLTNSSGKSLNPEIIALEQNDKTAKSKTKTLEVRAKPDAPASAQQKSQPGKKPKLTPAQAAKQMRFEKESAKTDSKLDKAQSKYWDAWSIKRKTLESISDGARRHAAIEQYLTETTGEKRELLEAEVKIFAVCALLVVLNTSDTKASSAEANGILAQIANALQDISKSQTLTSAEAKAADEIASHLNIPIEATQQNGSSRKLSFQIKLPSNIPTVTKSWKEFQLLHGGPWMDRAIDAVDDDRVPFKPDAWQRKVLDELDENNSVFVVAPTSAGKTFISFYAMRKVLKANSQDVLIYLAPTKALVNQIAAEVQARFTKKFPHAGTSVWAIHTRDHRINNPAGCQILVTVPHILQIMLLAPEMAKAWAPRVKRIIFDEIHCIGQAEDGLVWEQLLLLVPCPIIALSATVGNPDEFSSWLTSTQKSLGHDLVKVEHKHRFSDLRKYIYRHPKHWVFKGIPDGKSMAHGIEDPSRYAFVHPVAALMNRSRGIPEDLSLEARDCLELYNALKAVQTSKYSIAEDLGPKSLPKTITKRHVIEWESKLKAVLRAWQQDPLSPFEQLVKQFPVKFLDATTATSDTSESEDDSEDGKSQAAKIGIGEHHADTLEAQTLPLLISLQEQNALPAIVFNYDRSKCEDMCKVVLDQLVEAETKWKDTNPAWTKKLARYKQWQEKKAKSTKKTSSAGKKAKNDADEGLSGMDRAMMAGEEDIDEFEGFDPAAPVDLFSFANRKKLPGDELAVIVRRLRWRHVDDYLIDTLARGVGVHHAGMNRAYRQTVEILFRQGFLRVIIATGTLALGINMPCKTVVFSGDSIYLTALNYRQASGRAGRRGFDLLGNVVFHGLPKEKVFRLMSSRLPDLNGHFPVTTTLVLRLFSLLHNSDNSPYARQAINALLSQPRIYLGAVSFRQQVLHHLRFSIEYLRRQSLLAVHGQPINFAGLISHLYYTENSGFALHQLLKSGYLHEMAKDWRQNPDQCKEKLMLILSHIFGRQICKVSDREYMRKNLKLSSSMVFLPELPSDAKEILESHNASTRQIFTTYVRTFVKQHLADSEQSLPISGMTFEGDEETLTIDSLPEPQVRSAFVALSGHGDDFESVSDLCNTVRSGVFLEKAVVPHLDIFPDAQGRQLNAYLYDYFRNEDVRALLEDNRIRRAEVWFLLNDFSLVLATICASLNNYLTSRPISELSMMELRGGGEAAEVSKDDEQAAQAGETSDEPTTKAAAAAAAKAAGVQKKKKKKAVDSWEDDAEESSSSEEEEDDSNDVAPIVPGDGGLKIVLAMFRDLQTDFNQKFRKMWA